MQVILILLVVGWLALMLFLSHQNGFKSGQISGWISSRTRIPDSVIRRSAHVIVYGVFSFTFMFILMWFDIALWIGILICAVLSITDEATKPLSTFRHCEIKHELLNILGIVIGLVSAILIYRLRYG